MNSEEKQTQSFINESIKESDDLVTELEEQKKSFQSRAQYAFMARNEARRAIVDARVDIEKGVDEALNDAQRRAEESLEKMRGEIKDGVRRARSKIIEPLAVFVGLFTFASVSFQIFNQVREYILWMPILLMIFGALIVFAGVVIHASSLSDDVKQRRIYTWIVVGVGCLFIASAAVLYYFSSIELRAEDAKECVIVKESDSTNTYCKVIR